MIRTVYYRISSVEELESIKYEEVEYETERMINNQPPSATSLDYNTLARN
jgi:hypothetical protein